MTARLIGIALLSVLIGCVTKSGSDKIESKDPAVEQRSSDEIEFQKAQALLESGKSLEAEVAFRNFLSQYPQSRFAMLSRMGIGQSLEGQDKWTEAVSMYRLVQKLSVTDQPAITAQALYRLSYCYEALGEDDKAIATLLDSYRRRAQLPEEIGLAEIPARLAMLYEKAHNQTEAEKYVGLAQKGISSIQGRPSLSRQVLAKAYFQMGTVSLNQISSSNFSSVVRALKAVQIYPIRALALEQTPWSQNSLELLKKYYRDLWNVLIEMPGVSGVDDESIERSRRELQASLGGEFLDLIQQVELYGPLEPEKRSNSLQRELYSYLSGLKLMAQDLIYKSEAQMDLTIESQGLHSLKRPGRIRSDVLLPAEKGSRPQKGSPVLSQDPNL